VQAVPPGPTPAFASGAGGQHAELASAVRPVEVEEGSSLPGVWTLVTSGALLAAGYVILANRASLWLLGLLTGQPLLWKRLDPMEVLFAWDREKGLRPGGEHDPPAEETLQSLVR
jgi:hypothetical protein